MSLFALQESRYVAAVQSTVSVYLHAETGARHIHLANRDTERAFLVGFPTIPMKSDGRAHVLEHLLLCGSERYPVRDPFFAMMRRSVSTFMNAMTYPDRTVYPFATVDRADFFNLMDVYLDASFFPRLDRLNFLQEGWRHVLDGDQLRLQGVVLNEMKGYYGEPERLLYQGLQTELFRNTTYAVDSGGDPLRIPELTHEALKAFHAQHYHPSQAVFMSWGDVEPEAVQERIAERVLARLHGSAPLQRPQLASHWEGVRQVDIRVPAAAPCEHEHGLQLAWLLGETSDIAGVLRVRLMESALLDGSAAPLMQAIESAGFGRPSNILGTATDAMQSAFHLGMDGLSVDQLADAQSCLEGALQKVAVEGVPLEVLQSGVRKMRYFQRSPRKGVDRLLAIAHLALRGENVIAALDGEPWLAKLSQDIEAPHFLASQVQQLLDQKSCLVAHVVPDPEFSSQRDAQEAAALAVQSAALTADARKSIELDTLALDAHQRQQINSQALPRIRPQDLAEQPRKLAVWPDDNSDAKAIALDTNGITHAYVQVNVSALAPAQWPWLDLYAYLLTQLGAKEMGHLEASAWRQVMVSDFYVDFSVRPRLGEDCPLEVSFACSALREEQANLAQVVAAWFVAPKLQDADRVTYLLDTLLQTIQANLQQPADQFADLALKARASKMAAFQHQVKGLPSLDFYAHLRQLLGQEGGVQQIIDGLQQVHACLLASPKSLIAIGAQEDASAVLKDLQAALPCTSKALSDKGAVIALLNPCHLGIHVPQQVNQCGVVWRVPVMSAPEAPALAVAAQLLTQQLLHTALREQGGAYGAGAGYDALNGQFAIMTHSDPRLAATYADMQSCLQQFQTKEFDSEALEEAIVSVVKQLDPPALPVSDLFYARRLVMAGVSDAVRSIYRQGVLQCDLVQVRAVVQKCLDWQLASRCASVGNVGQELAGLQVLDLLDHARQVQLLDAE